MLNFKSISLAEQNVITPFTWQYGERSCQNSFVSWILRKDKYEDQYCLENGFLIVCRKEIGSAGWKEYLFPLGDQTDKVALKDCILKIRQDAQEEGKMLCFCSVTEQNLNMIEELFPGQFEAVENRDYFEYIFSAERMAKFPGKKLEDRRWQVNRFDKLYKDRYEIQRITPKDLEEIREFRKKIICAETADRGTIDPQLHYEELAFDIGMNHFEGLNLLGIVVRLDGKVCGYNIGVQISEDTVDGLFMKGDRSVKYIYSVLFQKFASYCCEEVTYINGEEDVGVEGLRTTKLELQPEYLLKKYMVTFY